MLRAKLFKKSLRKFNPQFYAEIRIINPFSSYECSCLCLQESATIEVKIRLNLFEITLACIANSLAALLPD